MMERPYRIEASLAVGSSEPRPARCDPRLRGRAPAAVLGSAEEFAEADDVLVAAKRVVDVRNVVQMMAGVAERG